MTGTSQTNSTLLQGRTALVTGASRGIGAAIARALGRHGADVAINYHRNHDAADAVAAQFGSASGRALTVAADATDGASIEAAVEQVRRELGEIDALVCNAIGDTSTIFERHQGGHSILDSGDAIRDRVSTQLDATLHACRSVTPSMQRQGGGSIVVIGAAGTHRSTGAGVAEVLIAKAAQDALVRLLATELGPHGIRVNIVAPGLVATDANADPQRDQLIESLSAQSPLRHISTPDDIADLVVALTSNLTRHVTGAFIAADDGLTMTA